MRLPRGTAAYVIMGFVLLIIALLIYGLISTNAGSNKEGAIAPSAREKAPDKKLPVLGSKGEKSLADWRGKVIVVNIWASWCGPCRDEAPVLERIWRKNRKDGVVMVGINTMDVTNDALKFVRQYKITFPSLRDGDGERKRAWGATGVPETYLVDRDGKIAWLRRGPIEGPELQRAIDRVLKEDSKDNKQ